MFAYKHRLRYSRERAPKSLRYDEGSLSPWLGIVVFSSQVVAGPAQGADYRDPHARAGIRGPRAGAAGGATEREGAPLRRHQLPIRLVIQ